MFAFSSENIERVGAPQGAGSSIIESDKLYFERLNLLVYSICEDYVRYIEEKQSKELFEHLCSLIVDFDTKKFFISLKEK
ncbi:hypothetical protein NQ314_019675 [Rhamnusium bicolor]|uniref:Uncharacterized protein n=1 Tax=Rhamnusium bicolor TaxID=1586634 RepID=A0AAV8WMT0_9CUCU|nr:hypothetical protein NQ314_019675 [Rhamnusium bicolor]